MSGNAKPNVVGLGKEAKYKVLHGHSNSVPISQCGLFDGSTPNEWDTENVFYWYDSNDYLELEIYNDCNIWRSGTKSWRTNIGLLTILEYKEGKYIDITNTIKQTTSPISNEQWEETIFNLKKGRYKFILQGGTRRIDSEWYIEKTVTFKFLLEQNNQLYTIKSDFYESSKLQYKPITSVDINNITDEDLKKYGFDDIGDILTEINIDKEKFKPIDKLKIINEGKFNILVKEID